MKYYTFTFASCQAKTHFFFVFFEFELKKMHGVYERKQERTLQWNIIPFAYVRKKFFDSPVVPVVPVVQDGYEADLCEARKKSMDRL